MAHHAVTRSDDYRNGSIAAGVVQQGTDNAGRDIAGRDINYGRLMLLRLYIANIFSNCAVYRPTKNRLRRPRSPSGGTTTSSAATASMRYARSARGQQP